MLKMWIKLQIPLAYSQHGILSWSFRLFMPMFQAPQNVGESQNFLDCFLSTEIVRKIFIVCPRNMLGNLWSQSNITGCVTYHSCHSVTVPHRTTTWLNWITSGHMQFWGKRFQEKISGTDFRNEFQGTCSWNFRKQFSSFWFFWFLVSGFRFLVFVFRSDLEFSRSQKPETRNWKTVSWNFRNSSPNFRNSSPKLRNSPPNFRKRFPEIYSWDLFLKSVSEICSWNLFLKPSPETCFPRTTYNLI